MTSPPQDGSADVNGTGPPKPAPRGLPRGVVVLIGTAAGVITAYGIGALSWLVGPAFLALVVVIVTAPVLTWLRRHGVPAWVATAAMALAAVGVLIVFFLILIVSIAQLATQLPLYTASASRLLGDVTAALRSFGIGPEQVQAALGAIDPGRLVDLAGTALAGVASVGSSLVFVLFLVLFLSVEASESSSRMAEIARDRPLLAEALHSFAAGTRRYLVVTTIFGVILGVADAVALTLLGVPLPLVWGVLALISNYVPSVGFIIAIVPPTVLALLVGGWQLMIAVLLVYGVLNVIVQSVLQTRYIGDAVGLSTVVTFIALAFWAWLLGPLGAVLAIPLTLLIKALLVDIDPRARWAQALFGANPQLGR